MFTKFALAERLGRTLAEIEELTDSDFAGWLAYFAAKKEIEENR